MISWQLRPMPIFIPRNRPPRWRAVLRSKGWRPSKIRTLSREGSAAVYFAHHEATTPSLYDDLAGKVLRDTLADLYRMEDER